MGELGQLQAKRLERIRMGGQEEAQDTHFRSMLASSASRSTKGTMSQTVQTSASTTRLSSLVGSRPSSRPASASSHLKRRPQSASSLRNAPSSALRDEGGESPSRNASESAGCKGDTGCTTYGDGVEAAPERALTVEAPEQVATASVPPPVPFQRKTEPQSQGLSGRQSLFTFELCLDNTAVVAAPILSERACISRYVSKRVVEIMDKQLTDMLRNTK